MKVYHCFPGGKAKALTMSYDDGKLADERLVAIFNQYGIKGTFNLNYGLLGRPDRIVKERIVELYEGHEIATHTMTHPTIARCPVPKMVEEILEDRKGLEALTGRIVRGHAYPNGSCSEAVKQLFSQLGIAYGRVVETNPVDVNGGIEETINAFGLPEDFMEWKATCHHDNPQLMSMAEMFANLNKKQYLKLMFVWGHSYEFDKNNNWEVIEEFCKYMGGRADIWYATNIEIVDYMQVVKNLQFSADGESVYNPSARSAWLTVNDVPVEIPGGAYVKLGKD